MTQPAQKSLYDEWSWVIGEDEPNPAITASTRTNCERRIAAMIFKRRSRLLFRWRLQAHRVVTEEVRNRAQIKLAHLACAPRDRDCADVVVATDLPPSIPPLRGEIAIWRSFLAEEIHDILFGSH